MQSSWHHPSLWRVTIFALIVGLFGNVLLWQIVKSDDVFANIIAVASGIAAVLLAICWFRFPKYLDIVLLIVFVIWTANAIEFALEGRPSWESKTRQGALYASQALLALGAYVGRQSVNPND